MSVFSSHNKAWTSGNQNFVHIHLPFTDSKNSKWVWSGNTTITNRRQPRGTARKSLSTITRHQEDKLSKATSSLYPIKTFLNHAREPLYSNSAVIAWCSQSTSAQIILFWFTVFHSIRQIFTTFNFHDVFFVWIYCLGIVVHSGQIRAFKFQNQQSTGQFLASHLDFMCLKCVQWLISVLLKSSIITLYHQIMKNTYKWRTRKFEMFLFIICEVASHFSSVRNFWVVKWTVPYVECLNM